MINLTTVLHVPMASEGVQHSARKLLSFADAHRKDPDLRSLADTDPVAALAEHDVEVQPGTEVRIAEDTDEVFHFVLPPDWNAGMGDEVLDMVAGGKCMGLPGGGSCLNLNNLNSCWTPPNLPGFSGYRP